MASLELQRLWKLHQIDSALLDIRNRAASLDPGRAQSAEVKRLQAELDASPARVLQGELTDYELQQKTLQEKVKKFEGQLYGGKVVNPREVETLQKEVAILKRQRDEFDERIIDLLDKLPEAKKKAEVLEQKLATAKTALAAQHKKALDEKAQLEADFKLKSAQRPEAAKVIPPALLQRYEGIRAKHAGVGMGEVVVRSNTCSACGTHLPERTIQSLKEDKVVTCESCHRILYYSEGVV